jgi:hypothetical protein
MHLLACDRRTLATGQQVAVMSAIVDLVGAPVPSQAQRASAYKQLRAVRLTLPSSECDELWCRFSVRQARAAAELHVRRQRPVLDRGACQGG